MPVPRIEMRLVGFVILCAIVLSGWRAGAHPMPSSVVSLSILEETIHGEARVPLIELENAVGIQDIKTVDTDFFVSYFRHHIIAQSGNDLWTTEIESLQIVTDHDPVIGQYREVIIRFKMIPCGAQQLRHFIFRYDAIIHQVVTHQALVFIKYDWRNAIYEESSSEPVGVVELDIPSGKIFPLEVNIEEGSWWKGFNGMFFLGMKHIREGLDHILFLLTLLLIAPLAIADRNWSRYQGWQYTLSRFMKISLAFTIGHSITLIAGSLNLISFRVQYVEILIALSIFISAINCIRPVFKRKEVFVAGGFGLIHGLAFSISLSSLELGLESKVLSILGFNLGIEAMQLIIMILFFPLLFLSKWNFYSKLRVGFAVVTMIVSISWIEARATSNENFITTRLNSIL